MEVYLLRHACPEEPGQERLCLGQKLDVPLSSQGKRECRELARRLSGLTFERVYVSPLRRARETAELLCPGKEQIVVPELTEVSGGVWDGMRFCDIYRLYPEYFVCAETGGKTPPGGESDEEALLRGLQGFDRIFAGGGRALAVTHSGLGRILLCHWMGLPLWQKRSIAFPYAGGYILTVQDGRVAVTPWEG